MTDLNKEDRILIVDDTLANIQLLGEFIQKAGYQLNVAQNGLQALDAVKAMPPDLILLDVMMPEMDGYETCQRLKADPETSAIPVIFLTAKVETADIVKGFRLGAVDYLTKPFNTEELFARVSTHLQLRRAVKQIESQKAVLEKQNEELIEAAKLREDVDNIIRHDLKTPLNAIIGYPQILLLKENLSEKGKEHIKIISDSGYRMLNMINLSLDLFKMERGVYQLQPAPVNILKVLKNIEMEMVGSRQRQELQLKIEVSGRPLGQEDTFMIFGEELLCYSLLANLLKNAVEASPEGESVTISVDKKEAATIRIHNQGVVPEVMVEKFFDKYTTFGKTTGTGLGTYSARLITETQRGQISMTTSETDGTTITIRLPAA
ncbi:MAG: hybrid sensor histidine kinase/response regulator [SAR324 cluster bacterium]|nr:hybrid sensor histidine kinase/response regulator [SAR324 cluster bacterium]